MAYPVHGHLFQIVSPPNPIPICVACPYSCQYRHTCVCTACKVHVHVECLPHLLRNNYQMPLCIPPATPPHLAPYSYPPRPVPQAKPQYLLPLCIPPATPPHLAPYSYPPRPVPPAMLPYPHTYNHQGYTQNTVMGGVSSVAANIAVRYLVEMFGFPDFLFDPSGG